MVSPEIFPVIKETHQWFYYPVRWESEDWYDKYMPEGFIEEVIQTIGKVMLWFAIIAAILSPILLLKTIKRHLEEKSGNHDAKFINK